MKSILFEWGPVTIYAYGTVMAVSFLTSLMVLIFNGKKQGFSTQQMMDIGLAGIVGGILGARIAYVLSHWQEYSQNWLEIIMIHHGGLAFYGGAIGGCLGVILLAKKNKYSFLSVLDLIVPAMVLGHAIGRVGCFFNGCCYGIPSNIFCAVQFPQASLPFYTFGLQSIHPVQIYSSILLVFLFFALMFRLKSKQYEGQILVWYLLGYPVIRFFLEFIRGDKIIVNVLGLTLFQIISVLLFFSGLLLRFRLKQENE